MCAVLILKGIATLQELETHWSFKDLFEYTQWMNIQSDMENESVKE